MLLRESLGNVNCRTTMIAHISAAAGSYAETLSTIQIASRVLRMKKKKTKVRALNGREECTGDKNRIIKAQSVSPFSEHRGLVQMWLLQPLASERESLPTTREKVECPFHG